MGNIFSERKQKTDTLNNEGLRNNSPEYLVLHSTRNYLEFEDALGCHRSKGWAGIGYHLFLSDSGILTQGRPFDTEGAHALGFNTNSIGLCIYSPDGSLKSEKIEMGKEIIESLQEEFGGLEVIPHTLTQVIYNNKLLRENEINAFPENINIAYEAEFTKLKKEIDNLTGRLDTQSQGRLKSSLKSFKNCPGEMFYNFI